MISVHEEHSVEHMHALLSSNAVLISYKSSCTLLSTLKKYKKDSGEYIRFSQISVVPHSLRSSSMTWKSKSLRKTFDVLLTLRPVYYLVDVTNWLSLLFQGTKQSRNNQAGCCTAVQRWGKHTGKNMRKNIADAVDKLLINENL